MRVRKTIATIPLLLCLSTTSMAADLRLKSPYFHQTGWDQKNIDAQTQSAVFLRARISKLEQENEQLRNGIEQLRKGHSEQRDLSYDVKIQSLVEENRRLSILLSKKPRTPQINADAYAGRIKEAQKKNDALRAEIGKIAAQVELKYKDEIQRHKEEGVQYRAENASLKKSLSTGKNNKSSKVSSLQNIVDTLKVENNILKEKVENLSQYKTIKAEQTDNSSAMVKQKTAELARASAALKELQEENRKLGQSLATATGRVFDYQERSDKAVNTNNTYVQDIKKLNGRLASLQKENSALETRLSQSEKSARTQKASVETSDDGIVQLKELKEQNKSLRDTIKAQSKLLVSSDNAVKTAERLIEENKLLKGKLQRSVGATAKNGKSAQDLLDLNQKLQNEAAQRDIYISQLEGLKDTVKQLRMTNDRQALSNDKSKDQSEQIIALQDVKISLEKSLAKERDNTIAYRTKIREYQDEGAMIQGQLTESLLKNQELEARIQLLQDESREKQAELNKEKASASKKRAASKSKKNKKNKIIARAASKDSNEKEKVTDVSYIDTPYPPVEDVLPLLSEKGEHIDYAQLEPSAKNGEMNAEAIKSEDLLSQDLLPLSEQKKKKNKR